MKHPSTLWQLNNDALWRCNHIVKDTLWWRDWVVPSLHIQMPTWTPSNYLIRTENSSKSGPKLSCFLDNSHIIWLLSMEPNNFIPAKSLVQTFMSSLTHDLYMVYMAAGEGGPMYCLMSARSTKARSIAPVILDVVNIITLLFLLKRQRILSQW